MILYVDKIRFSEKNIYFSEIDVRINKNEIELEFFICGTIEYKGLEYAIQQNRNRCIYTDIYDFEIKQNGVWLKIKDFIEQKKTNGCFTIKEKINNDIEIYYFSEEYGKTKNTYILDIYNGKTSVSSGGILKFLNRDSYIWWLTTNCMNWVSKYDFRFIESNIPEGKLYGNYDYIIMNDEQFNSFKLSNGFDSHIYIIVGSSLCGLTRSIRAKSGVEEYWFYLERNFTNRDFSAVARKDDILKELNCKRYNIFRGKNGKQIKLKELKYDRCQIDELNEAREKKLDESFFDPRFYPEQLREIRLGLESGISVKVYADPDTHYEFDFNHLQMEQIRLGLESGINVRKYAKRKNHYKKMEKIRKKLESEKRTNGKELNTMDIFSDG